ncbi:hypothetical protein B7P43_G08755 [Cryptotermes secundus]|uniref:Uncharacterized protein n=1 Tax=Cryptotermes secundus TaxID=105785 RepID=A0A2J7RNS5_9NEOP|nr:hypothetical protein B7P43_G08755 [Cryptotermes secundus]
MDGWMDGCEDNWFTNDAEIGFSPPGDSGRHIAPFSRMRQQCNMRDQKPKEMARIKQGGDKCRKIYGAVKFRFHR